MCGVAIASDFGGDVRSSEVQRENPPLKKCAQRWLVSLSTIRWVFSRVPHKSMSYTIVVQLQQQLTHCRYATGITSKLDHTTREDATILRRACAHGQVVLEALPVALDPGVPLGLPVPMVLGSRGFPDLRHWLRLQRHLAMAWPATALVLPWPVA